MSNLIGADIVALRSFGQRAMARSHEIDAMMARLQVQMESLPWVGADRERFLDEWHGHHRLMVDLARDLGSAAQRAISAAEAQERASQDAAERGGGHGGGSGW